MYMCVLGADHLISLVFTCVDHEQPDQQFRVTLDVSDTGHWEGKSLQNLILWVITTPLIPQS